MSTELSAPKTRYNKIELDRKDPKRMLGFGALPDKSLARPDQVKRIAGMCSKAWKCPTYLMDMIESTTIHFGGPLTAAQIAASFGQKISPFSANVDSPPAGALQVDSTLFDPGKTQTFAMVSALQWRIDLEPVNFTAHVNAFTAPAVATGKPVSPDAFSALSGAGTPGSNTGDLTNGGPLGLSTGNTLIPAFLQWGVWADMAYYYMCRGYNLTWQYGHYFYIMNESLRYTAFTPDNSQNGTGSSSEIDIAYYTRLVNEYYRSNLSTTAIALLIDRARVGNLNLGAAGQSAFRLSNAYQTTGVTYGGTALHSLIGRNNEFRRLNYPFLVWPGVAIGIAANAVTSGPYSDASLMQSWLNAGNGLGGTIPATFTEDVNINGNTPAGFTAGTTSVEPSLDSAAPSTTARPPWPRAASSRAAPTA